jgi:transcriptional regulator with XRE-family HTH domain
MYAPPVQTKGATLDADGEMTLDQQHQNRISSILRAVRLERGLSLREVEERCLSLARKNGHDSYRISAVWLSRMETHQRDMTIKKLIVLAKIYDLSPEQLLRSICPADYQRDPLRELSSPNATTLLTAGPLEEQAEYLLAASLNLPQVPDETMLLPSKTGGSTGRYRQGILGKCDHALDPMIPAGSVIQIDAQDRAMPLRRNWANEFQRPIHFLMTRECYVCGWCELDKDGDWLTIIPHPLSSASSRRWKYRQEIEIIGRVSFVTSRL